MISPNKWSAQPVTCPLHPHLQRRYADACYSRHLIVRQLFDVLEKKCFPLIRRQHAQRVLDVPTDVRLALDFRTWCDRSLDRVRRRSKAKLAATLSRRVGPALVDDDLVKPTSETFRVPAAAQAPEGPHESRLQRIIRVDPRSKHPHGKPSAGVLIAPNQPRESLNVPGKNGGNQFRI